MPSPSAHNDLEDLLAYLRMLAGDAPPGRYLDVRVTKGSDLVRRRFVSAHRVPAAAALVACLAPHGDVYVGVALRDGQGGGGRRAISGSHLVFIERDCEDRERRLEGFPFPPSVEIDSGTPGHRHLYWRLSEPATGRDVESANRRLALALGGDPASVDLARLLRPPLTLNHKHAPPRPVRLLAHREGARYPLADLLAALPGDPRPPKGEGLPARRSRPRSAVDRALRAIPAAEYVRVLQGLEPDRRGKLLCPFHADSRPSLQLYPDRSWYCFGCRRGGTIIDFAAASWRLGTRGEDFLELRHRLAAAFGLDSGTR